MDDPQKPGWFSKYLTHDQPAAYRSPFAASDATAVRPKPTPATLEDYVRSGRQLAGGAVKALAHVPLTITPRGFVNLPQSVQNAITGLGDKVSGSGPHVEQKGQPTDPAEINRQSFEFIGEQGALLGLPYGRLNRAADAALIHAAPGLVENGKLLKALTREGGATLAADGSAFAGTGFAVADPALTGSFKTRAEAEAFLARPDVKKALADGGHIGKWTDPKSGVTEINITNILPTEKAAQKLAAQRGEQAIGHLEGGEYKGDIANPFAPVPEAKALVAQMNGGKMLPRVTAIPEERGKQLAATYENLPVHDPKAKQAYTALNSEIEKQYAAIEKAGYKIEYTKTDPYKNSAEMMKDLRENKTLKVFATPAGGAHPFMTDVQNNRFRAVHDFLAHGGGGNQFGAIGEENAYRIHASTLSPDAQRALATETRGQNSWVNYGPSSHLPVGERPFAQQKAALFPEGLLGDYESMQVADANENILGHDAAGNAYTNRGHKIRPSAPPITPQEVPQRTPVPIGGHVGERPVTASPEPSGVQRLPVVQDPKVTDILGRIARKREALKHANGEYADQLTQDIQIMEQQLRSRRTGTSGAGTLSGMTVGGASGAAAGGQVGDTPEERMHNSLLGLGVGMVGGAVLGGHMTRGADIGDVRLRYRPGISPESDHLLHVPARTPDEAVETLLRDDRGAPKVQGSAPIDPRMAVSSTRAQPSELAQAVAESPSVEAGLQKDVERGLPMGGDQWYETGPIKQSYGEMNGPYSHTDFNIARGSGSIQTPTHNEVANATGLLFAERQGLGTAGELQKVHQEMHPGEPKLWLNDATMGNYQRAREAGAQLPPTPISDYRKVPWYTHGNEGGSLDAGVALDTHERRKLLMLASRDPKIAKLIKELGIPLQEGRKHNLIPIQNGLDYDLLSTPYQRIAKKLGLPSSQAAQAGRWIGGGKETGLFSQPEGDFTQTLEDVLMHTAQTRGLPTDPASLRSLWEKLAQGEDFATPIYGKDPLKYLHNGQGLLF